MKLHRLPRLGCGFALAVSFALTASAAGPVGSTFTYQGVVTKGGAPLPDGSIVDFQFTLWDGTGGAAVQIGSTQTFLGLTINGSLITQPIDFGAAAFAGEERWLQIAIRHPPGSGGYTKLLPLQALRPSPYAIHAQSVAVVPNAALAGGYSGALSFSNAGNSFTGSGAGLTSLNASSVSTGNLSSSRLPTGGSWTLSTTVNINSNLFHVDPTLNRVAIGGLPGANKLTVTETNAAIDAVWGLNSAAAGAGSGSGVVGMTGQASALAAGVFAENSNANGTGLIALANGQGSVVLPNGSGAAMSGLTTGAYARSTTASVGQGLYAEQFGDVVRVAYWSGATFFKINGTGTVSTIVRDTNDKPVNMYCPESPEILLTDYGQGQLINGFAHIDLDPILARNILVDDKHPLRVFIQLEDNENCEGVIVKNKTATGFDVVELRGGRSNTPFQYQVTGNRADEVLSGGRISRNADARFEPANPPEALVHD